MIRATAWDTAEKSARWPQWKSSGSLGVHEELIERESARAQGGQKGGEAVNPLGDLVDFRLHVIPPIRL